MKLFKMKNTSKAHFYHVHILKGGCFPST